MLRWFLNCVICNSKSFHSSIFKLCIMIVHTLNICPSFLCKLYNIFLLLGLLTLDIFPSEMFKGCLVCVICNSNSIQSFIFKLCKMIVHTLKMCTSYFMHISFFFSFLGSSFKSLQEFSFLNIQTLHSDCSYIEHVPLFLCKFDQHFLTFRAVELRHFFLQRCLGGA